MMKLMRTLMLGAGLAVVSATGAFAHHSAAMFDQSQVVTVSGVVREFQYTNPHSWLVVDVTNEDGSTTVWGFEAEGPSTLITRIAPRDVTPDVDLTTDNAAPAIPSDRPPARRCD